MDDFLGLFLEILWPLAEGICKGIVYVFTPLWRAYTRILNLPILAAVAVDSVGGMLGGISLMDSAGLGLTLLGFGLMVGAPIFFLASLLSWAFKVLDETEENERRQLASGS